MPKVAFVDTLPKCNFHDRCVAKYDFKTVMGPWANGCESAWLENRAYQELGTGMGQQLIVR